MAEIGRFIQEDPFKGLANFPLSINNKYIYVINNPANMTDPSGKIAPILAAALIGAAISTTVYALTTNSFTLKGFLGAALGGAAAGAVGASLTALFVGKAGFAALSGWQAFVVGGTSSAAGQTVSLGVQGKLHEKGSLTKIGTSFVLGGVIGYGVNGYISTKPTDKVTEQLLQKTGEINGAGTQSAIDKLIENVNDIMVRFCEFNDCVQPAGLP